MSRRSRLAAKRPAQSAVSASVAPATTPDGMFPIDFTLTQIDEAFPATVRRLMPAYNAIPRDHNNRAHWLKLFRDMFFSGLTQLALLPREGVNQKAAWRHVRCIAGSFEPQHEHKEAAFAWLMDQWFSGGTWSSK